MSTQIVASWSLVIVKGMTFTKRFAFTDEDGTPIPYTDFEIVVTPTVGSPFTWSVGSGNVTFISTGIYSVLVDDTDTAAYTWSSGRYRLSVVDGSGNPIPCLIEGLAFAKDC